MSPTGASLRGQQVVVAVALVEVWTFGETDRGAPEDQVDLPDQLAFARRVLLQYDSGEAVLSGPVVPQHVDQILPSIVVMKQGGIEAAAVEVNRIRPLA